MGKRRLIGHGITVYCPHLSLTMKIERSVPDTLADLAKTARAWPFEEARKLAERIGWKTPAKGHVLFETGYGPSGLPHIGTFGEVVRTTMVRHAFEVLTEHRIPTRLLCVSDDMDGMRKVPDNVPGRALLEPYLQQPLTQVPDPFGTHKSFGHHNNARLRGFLDSFGFQYEFASATDLYRTGVYDRMLRRVLERYEAIQAIMLPTLGPERRATYSPVLPISPKTGRVLYVPLKAIDAVAGTVTFDDEDGSETTVPVTGGHCKLQWKPDFGMRWAALGVDFEMYGKDHLTNGDIYSRICKALGAEPPHQFYYELFLDDKGEKISKSKGNGISVEQWLTYASPQSLALYMFNKPRTAKKLYFDVIPKAADDYYQHVAAFAGQDEAARLENPAWHIHSGGPVVTPPPVSFALLLNLVGVANTKDPAVLWSFVSRYAPGVSSATQPELDRLIHYALAYYRDFVLPTRTLRLPTDQESAALADLSERLSRLTGDEDSEAIQGEVYAVGKAHGWADNLRGWFQVLYEVLLGTSQGPRMGSFIKLYGIAETRALIARALAR